MASVTRRPSRSAGQREAVIAEVSAAVERLLGEGNGYTTLGVQRIAAEAGIARSTFYLYFTDKTALLLRVAEAATDELFAVAGSWLADGFADRDALERTLSDVIDQHRAHPEIYAALSELAGYDEQIAGFWRGRMGGFIDRLAARLRDGQRAGTITASLDPPITAAWIAWGTERQIAQHVASRATAEDARLAAGLANAIWATLGRAA